MIEERDLDAAVAAGVIDAGQREALVGFVRAHRRGAAGPDEEQFRLLTGFNDIFVTIAIGLLLAAVMLLAGPANAMLGSLGVAVTSWILAEYFTRQRRMALPSIALLLAFVGSVFVAALVLASGGATMAFGGEGAMPPALAAAGVAAAAAAWVHWSRFMVPITVAAGAGALTLLAVAATQVLHLGGDAALAATGLCGLATFALAMYFDASDRARVTRRTDVAFWLHLLAAPLIIHPVFALTGLFTAGSVAGPGAAVSVLAVYLVLTVVALAIDRRALLVSGLLYVIYAVNTLVTAGGSVGNTGAGFTVLLLGLFLVALSALWRPIRHRVIAMLPGEIAQRLPAAA